MTTAPGTEPPIRLRPARPDDLPACVGVWHAGLTEYGLRVGRPAMPPSFGPLLGLLGHLLGRFTHLVSAQSPLPNPGPENDYFYSHLAEALEHPEKFPAPLIQAFTEIEAMVAAKAPPPIAAILILTFFRQAAVAAFSKTTTHSGRWCQNENC